MRSRTRSFLVALTTGAVALAGFVVLGATPSSAVDAAPSAPPSDSAGPNEEISHIVITIDGFPIATFGRLVSLTTEVGVSGSPVPAAPPSVVLRRDLIQDTVLSQWQEAVAVDPVGGRKSCSVVMYNAEGEEIARYWFEKAWPFRIQVRPGTGSAVEVLTLMAEYVQRIAVE